MTLLQRQIAFLNLLRAVKLPGERPGDTVQRALRELLKNKNTHSSTERGVSEP
jgi:hypothetical protein